MASFGGFGGFNSAGMGFRCDAGHDAVDAAGEARRAGSAVRDMQRQVDRLAMICEAMWELLKEQSGMDDDQLMAKIAQLDLSDGEADGKKAVGGPKLCPQCQRPNSRKRDFCIYCGQLIRTKPFD